MKIGINNIFTSFWFTIMLLSSGWLSYISFAKNLFTSELFFIGKIIMGIMILLFIGIFLYLLYKFRILIIDNKNIVSIYPFLLKKEKIALINIKKIKLKSWTGQNGTVHRKISLIGLDSNLEFTDKEFENFENLTDKIPNVNRKEIDFEQAKGNLSSINFNVYLLSGFLLFLICNTIWNSGFHLIILIIFACNIILLFASIKRKLNYKKILKTIHNTI